MAKPRRRFDALWRALPALVLTAAAGLGPAPTIAGAAVTPAPAAAPAAAADQFAWTVLDLVNRDRVAYGLPPVQYDPTLLEVARERAVDQIDQPRLTHYEADGQMAFVQLLDQAGIDYQLAGENLARVEGALDAGTAQRAETALMHSPTHRANILEPTFDQLAVGVTTDPDGRVIFAQIFRNSTS